MKIRRTLLRLFTFALSLSTLLAQDGEDQAGVFEQELARVQRKMESGDWKVALRRLERTLEAHEGGAYVLQSLGEVELALKRCVFWEGRGKVDLGEGLAGEFDYDLRTGKIELSYAAGKPTDFKKQGFAQVLPVVFSGPYSVEVTDGADPTLIVCAKEKQSVSVGFSRVFHLGVGNPNHKKPTQRSVELRAQLRERDGDLVDETKSKDFTSKRSLESRKYKVSVSSTMVKATFNGKSLISCSKPKDLWGQVAFPLTVPDSDIVVQGEARTWLQSRLDAAVEDDWKRFEKEWDLQAHVPAWMQAALKATPRAPTGFETGITPASLSQADIEAWNAAVEHYEGEDLSRAVEAIDALLEREPRLGEGYRLKANALMRMRDREEAVEALQAGVANVPGLAVLRRELAQTLLLTGRFEEALAAIADAIGAGFPASDLQDLSITANKALHGPAWSVKNEYGSRHFDVASDLSKDVCRKVALELEETFRHVSRRLRLGEHIESRKFQVYVFSGAGRYQDYISDVFGGQGENTLGMYSPFLKQLLVLDSPQHDLLMHTVRHEGFHQLLDSELDDPPNWLNEGLAEYFAAARTEGGSWKDGQIHATRLAALQGKYRGRLIPLEEFLYQDQATFLKDPALGYAQAWGLVQFLRHSTRENSAALEALLEGLRSGLGNREALDAAFAGRDLGELDSQLLVYVTKL